jgi:hypothetical protein
MVRLDGSECLDDRHKLDLEPSPEKLIAMDSSKVASLLIPTSGLFQGE